MATTSSATVAEKPGKTKRPAYSRWSLCDLRELNNALGKEQAAALIAQNGNFTDTSDGNPFSKLWKISGLAPGLLEVQTSLQVTLPEGKTWKDEETCDAHLPAAVDKVRLLRRQIGTMLRRRS